MSLENKVAIITGGATGIGFGIARRFLKAGAKVIIASRNEKKLKQAAEALKDFGKPVLTRNADITDHTQITDLMDHTISEQGQIDILVNNAAMITPYTPFIDITLDHWNEVINTNLTGTFLCTQAVISHMIGRKYGKIINITSMAALGCITPGLAPYIVSKVGIIGLTKVCAKEFGSYGINVNSIAVGRIHTQMSYEIRTKEQIEEYLEYGKRAAVLGRLGQPDDIANLAVFLASDESSFITGQIIHSDGGRMDRM